MMTNNLNANNITEEVLDAIDQTTRGEIMSRNLTRRKFQTMDDLDGLSEISPNAIWIHLNNSRAERRAPIRRRVRNKSWKTAQIPHALFEEGLMQEHQEAFKNRVNAI